MAAVRGVEESLAGYRKEYREASAKSYLFAQFVGEHEEALSPEAPVQPAVQAADAALDQRRELNCSLKTARWLLEQVKLSGGGNLSIPSLAEKNQLEVEIYEAKEQLRKIRARRDAELEKLRTPVLEIESLKEEAGNVKQEFQNDIQADLSAIEAKRASDMLAGADDAQITHVLHPGQKADTLALYKICEKLEKDAETLYPEEKRLVEEVDSEDAKLKRNLEICAKLETELADLKNKAHAMDDANLEMRFDKQRRDYLEELQECLAVLSGIRLSKVGNTLQIKENPGSVIMKVIMDGMDDTNLSLLLNSEIPEEREDKAGCGTKLSWIVDEFFSHKGPSVSALRLS